MADPTVPAPDPTVATNDAVERAVQAERDYADGRIAVLEERLRAIDVATRLLNETVNRVPTDVTKEVTHLRELMDERLASVAIQFKERDTRSERESRDNKVAVDAAFAAQKEAAAKQDEGNLKAIDKSERATQETIKTNAELSRADVRALAGTVDDLKDRVVKMESIKQGIADIRTDQRAEHGANIGSIMATVGIASVVVAIAGIIIAIILKQ